MFKVGDFIEGVSSNPYGVTTRGWQGIVVYTFNENARERNRDDNFYIPSDENIQNEGDAMYVVGLNTRDPLKVYTVANRSGFFNNIKYSEIDFSSHVNNVHIDADAYCLTDMGYGIAINGNEKYTYSDIHVDHKTELAFVKIEEVDENDNVGNVNTTISDFMFDKSEKISWTDEEKESLREEIKELFSEYRNKDDVRYQLTDSAVLKMLNISNDNKGWIENWMSKHPNYNRDAHSITVTSKFTRLPDRDKINDFLCYLKERFNDYLYQFKVEPPCTKAEFDEFYVKRKEIHKICQALQYLPNPHIALYDDHNIAYYEMERAAYDDFYKQYEKYIELETLYNSHGTAFRIGEKESDDKYDFGRFCTLISKSRSDRIDQTDADYINNVLKYYEFVRAVEGQKWSTIVKKVAKHFGITEHKYIVTKEWTDADTGEVKSREVDMGWNKQFTIFCDSIKPNEKKMKVVVSVNPYDFFTQSFGSSWASCMTIDKTNLRYNGSGNYEGCYSGGTTDYAEDESTVVMYLLPEDYNGTTPYMEDKIKRCLFFMGEDKFVQSRVYPDGRDGTDYTDISKQMRNVMEDIINVCSENVDKTMWAEKEKVDNDFMKNFVEGKGHLHYKDYFEYHDIYVIRNKNVKLNAKKIQIGNAHPTCLCCGDVNHSSDSVICSTCFEEDEDDYVTCDRCGDRIRISEAITTDDGNYYCCNGCANSDNYYYCQDTDRYEYEDDCYYDEYQGRHYTYEDADRIHTEDGYDFHGDSSAEYSGYRETSDGKWYKENEVYYCEKCGCYVHETNWDFDKECCVDCAEEVEEVTEE